MELKQGLELIADILFWIDIVGLIGFTIFGIYAIRCINKINKSFP